MREGGNDATDTNLKKKGTREDMIRSSSREKMIDEVRRITQDSTISEAEFFAAHEPS